MKATGIVRKVDELGRVVLPIELRRKANIDTGDGLEIFVEKENIIIRPYRPGCIFCNEVSNITEVKGKKICMDCVKEISEDAK